MAPPRASLNCCNRERSRPCSVIRIRRSRESLASDRCVVSETAALRLPDGDGGVDYGQRFWRPACTACDRSDIFRSIESPLGNELEAPQVSQPAFRYLCPFLARSSPSTCNSSVDERNRRLPMWTGCINPWRMRQRTVQCERPRMSAASSIECSTRVLNCSAVFHLEPPVVSKFLR